MKRITIRDVYWLAVLGIITLFFILPSTNKIYLSVSSAHPYLVGFLKFAILATMGGMLAQRLAQGEWKRQPGLGYKAIAWGCAGMAITFAFSFFYNGTHVAIENGLLPTGPGFLKSLLPAFFTSLIMNATFGPVLMIAHAMWDVAIDYHARGEKPSMPFIVSSIHWEDFFSFVIGKTIPFWWIPAHTFTFMLPAQYRVLVSAYLSIVLGVILVYARNRKKISAPSTVLS